MPHYKSYSDYETGDNRVRKNPRYNIQHTITPIPMKDDNCISRSGVNRPEHSYDKDGICVFCDKIDGRQSEDQKHCYDGRTR